MKSAFCLMLVLTVASINAVGSSLEVTSVTARQRYPWNGKVDVVVLMTGDSNDVANAECSFLLTNKATGAAMAIPHISGDTVALGAATAWSRKFVWDAAADLGEVNMDGIAIIADVEISKGGVQLWENGPYWAECNVGAEKPEECGYYFWWGGTVGYEHNASKNGWVSVKDGTSSSFLGEYCPTFGKDNSALQLAGYIDSTGNLVAVHDAATVHLGSPWRMPTAAEIGALVDNCTTTWTTANGVYGRLVTGKGAYASRSIFLPAAGYGYISDLNGAGSCGYYWSSTPNSDYSNYAWDLYFYSGNFYRGYDGRCFGQSVRPVRGFAK